MAEASFAVGESVSSVSAAGHRAWVRVCHWLGAVSFFALIVTGFLILMVHPRLYWGKVGNDLMPAILELPISNNHRPEGWVQAVTFSEFENSPISANRTYGIFNQNGWARSLHFLSAWLLVVAGSIYLLAGIATGHLWRNLIPRPRDFRLQTLGREIRNYLRFQFGSAGGGAPYGSLQRWTYVLVVLIAAPFMVLTGLTMSPAVTAAYPILLDIFGGQQSARTLHFVGFAALVLFFLVHVAMVILTGFRRQMRAMILGD